MKNIIKILELINTKKRVSTKEIKKAMQISDRAVYKILAKLISTKKIKRIGRPPKVFYIPYSEAIASTLITTPYKVTKQQQIKELTFRVPPVLNVDIVIHKDGKFLIGRRTKKHEIIYEGNWLFPGGRMHFDETPQETAIRVLINEVPGVEANVRTLVTALSDQGHDIRAYNVTLYYLCDYVSGTPQPNYQLDDFKWVTYDEVKDMKNMHDYDKQVFKELDKHLKVMHSSYDEILVEVDENDKEIGQITKRAAHSTTTRYHRAAHIMIYTSDGKLVLHQRSLNKIDGAGRWDMFGGHQVLGQTIKQTAASELAEELGVQCDLKYMKKTLNKRNNQNEYSYLYVGVSNGPYGFDRNEVEKIDFFDPEKVLKGDYDKEFDIMAHVKKYIKETDFAWRL